MCGTCAPSWGSPAASSSGRAFATSCAFLDSAAVRRRTRSSTLAGCGCETRQPCFRSPFSSRVARGGGSSRGACARAQRAQRRQAQTLHPPFSAFGSIRAGAALVITHCEVVASGPPAVQRSFYLRSTPVTSIAVGSPDTMTLRDETPALRWYARHWTTVRRVLQVRCGREEGESSRRSGDGLSTPRRSFERGGNPRGSVALPSAWPSMTMAVRRSTNRHSRAPPLSASIATSCHQTLAWAAAWAPLLKRLDSPLRSPTLWASRASQLGSCSGLSRECLTRCRPF